MNKNPKIYNLIPFILLANYYFVIEPLVTNWNLKFSYLFLSILVSAYLISKKKNIPFSTKLLFTIGIAGSFLILTYFLYQ
jgi:hypothetical protein